MHISEKLRVRYGEEMFRASYPLDQFLGLVKLKQELMHVNI
jgi:hypothetical protein